MSLGVPLQRPLRFLGLFALVLALSLPAWEVLSGLYLAAVVHGANAALALLHVPLRVPGAADAASAYPGVAGAATLFLVTPRRSLGWRLRWLGGLLGLLFLLHAGLLSAEVRHLALATDDDLPLAVRLGRRWGTSLLVVWVWLAALRARGATAAPAPAPAAGSEDRAG